MKFWCATAFMESRELVQVARYIDEAGYYGITLSDHIVYPHDLKSPYPYSPHPDGRPIWDPETPWPDTWVLIGALTSVTERVHFTQNIYVAGNRPILQVAKQVATAAVLSDDRVTLGVAAGWMREEFELQGQDWDNRGPRLSEMIHALKELWKGGWVEFHGEYYDIPALTMEPHPAKPIPIYSGGHTTPALKRAANHADGWIGNAYAWDEAAHHIGRLQQFRKEAGRENEPFEIIIGLYEMPSVDIYKRAEEELGVTGMLCMPWAMMEKVSEGAHAGLRERAKAYQAPIERFAEEIVSKCQ